MNILEVQEALKNMSEQQLVREVQRPSGNAPVFLVATELDRRQKMKARYNKQRPPQSTVVEDLLGGIGAMMPMQKSAYAPNSGGVMKLRGGGMPRRGGGMPSFKSFMLKQAKEMGVDIPMRKRFPDYSPGAFDDLFGDADRVREGLSPYQLEVYEETGLTPAMASKMLSDFIPSVRAQDRSGMPQKTREEIEEATNNMVEMLRGVIAGRPVRKMAVGGLAGLGRAIPKGFLGRQTERLSDLSPIPKGQGIVPYVAGTSRITKSGGYAPQMGFFGPKNSSLGVKALRSATLSSPFGLGAFFASPTDMGDGTLAGAYGLTQDEFEQVLQYMMQNGLDFPTNSPEFADLAAQLTGKNVPRLPSLGVPAEQRSQEAARVQAQQQEDEIKRKQAETKGLFDQIAEMDERRRKQALQLGIARAGLAAVGQPNLIQALKAGGKEVLDTVQESSKPSSLQSFIIKERIKKMIAGGDKNLQNILKFRQELGKLFGDTMEGTPERQQLADQIKQLDLMIAQMLGLGTGGAPSGISSADIAAELAKRSR
jgi:hypothetical protein